MRYKTKCECKLKKCEVTRFKFVQNYRLYKNISNIFNILLVEIKLLILRHCLLNLKKSILICFHEYKRYAHEKYIYDVRTYCTPIGRSIHFCVCFPQSLFQKLYTHAFSMDQSGYMEVYFDKTELNWH